MTRGVKKNRGICHEIFRIGSASTALTNVRAETKRSFVFTSLFEMRRGIDCRRLTEAREG